MPNGSPAGGAMRRSAAAAGLLSPSRSTTPRGMNLVSSKRGSLAQSGAMNVSEVMVQYLKAAGIGHVFGYPGDPNVEFMESARRAGMQFVLGRREGTAGLMAEAYGFLTGRPGVCMSTLGPGSSNLVNAVANAFLDRVPMIAISGQIERKR